LTKLHFHGITQYEAMRSAALRGSVAGRGEGIVCGAIYTTTQARGA
jgi:hypothetical protein